MKRINVKNITLGDDSLFVIAGPCVIENEKDTIEAAKRLKEIAQEVELPFIFKASYDKANRSSVEAFRGPGIKAGLDILKKVADICDLPVISDIHGIEDIASASQVLDIIQIPAFLCRQTDLLVETGKTGKVVNVKKGQFMAPWDMKNVIEKVRSTGNEKIVLTERGTTFGYNNLVTDMRTFPIMKDFGYPVVFDATHSVQLPGGAGSSSGGQREFVAPLARAAVAAGANGLFLEVHENPDRALCDGPNSLAIHNLKGLLQSLKAIHSVT